MDIVIFPASQLGTDADMLRQLRSGALDFFAQTGLIVATLVPAAAITGVGFAFNDYGQVWSAVDGALSKHIIDAFAAANLVPLIGMWDNGFRQTTSGTKPIKTPDDLKGFKIRVPPSPLWTSLFVALVLHPSPYLGARPIRPCRRMWLTGLMALCGNLLRQDARGAEVHLPNKPHVGRLLVLGQPPLLRGASGVAEGCNRQERE